MHFPPASLPPFSERCYPPAILRFDFRLLLHSSSASRACRCSKVFARLEKRRAKTVTRRPLQETASVWPESFRPILCQREGERYE